MLHRLRQDFHLTCSGLELRALSWHKRCIMTPSLSTTFYRRDSRVLRFLPNENVNEQRGHSQLGVRPESLPCCSCRLIGPRGLVVWPHRTGLCVKDTWAKMADHDILNVRVTAAPFLQGGSCQKGSVVCNVIHCKFYTEEIHVIKAVHTSEESDLRPGHYD